MRIAIIQLSLKSCENGPRTFDKALKTFSSLLKYTTCYILNFFQLCLWYIIWDTFSYSPKLICSKILHLQSFRTRTLLDKANLQTWCRILKCRVDNNKHTNIFQLNLLFVRVSTAEGQLNSHIFKACVSLSFA